MKKLVFYFFFFHLTLISAQVPELQQASDQVEEKWGTIKSKVDKKNPTTWVNPFIGTGGHGHTFPGATAPFGMIQLSPDTRHDGWDGCSGYHYSDSIIYGFSHTHLSGTGVPDYCDLLVLPTTKKGQKLPGYLSKKGFGAKFKHANESAKPGFYSVLLHEENIQVRLAAGKRAAIHEYSFPENNKPKLVILDLEHRDKLLKAEVFVDSKNKNLIEGSRISSSWASEQHFYFSMLLSSPYQKIKKLKGRRYAVYFPKNTKKLYLFVGISAVDKEGARKNLESENNPDAKDYISKFTSLLTKTMLSWDKELSGISINSSNKDFVTNFYTALYHAYTSPNLFSDIDGRYRGRDNKIHQVENDNQYTVFSLWDTYRGNHPLFTITQQQKTSAFIRTFLRQYEEGGDLPVWELAGNETECMIGYHAVSVIADAYMKGIEGFDANKALMAMHHTSQINEFGKNHFQEKGFISAEQEPESVSKTLEYAYDEFCISEMAKKLNNDTLASKHLLSSYYFINLFDPTTKFMRARRQAQWYSPFSPNEVNFNYTEANSWQYSLYAPQHIAVLRNLLGGPDSLESWLDRLFSTTSELSGREQADITGLIGQYAHGNEPSHHMAYLYNYTNAPYKTQYYVDKILKEMYRNAPDGLSGNEDCGQMSAWFVLSSLGIYPIAPGKPVYEIGRPKIDGATIRLENGNKIEIFTLNNDENHPYIQFVKWNNIELKNLQINHSDLMAGGVLVVQMGEFPNKNIKGNVDDEKVPNTLVPVPFIMTEERVFDDVLKISLGHVKLHASDEYFLFYSIDSSEWEVYEKPFIITKSCKVSLKLQRRTADRKITHSKIVSGVFTKREPGTKLNLKTAYAKQYAASGDFALVDGSRGGNEFRTGDWQGFYGEDVVAEVSFDSIKNLSRFGVSAIRDQKSWIFFPSKIEVEISKDGTIFEKLPPIQIKQAEPTDKNPERMEFFVDIAASNPVKVIRYKISNPGVCPTWHLGNGNKTWLFIDELLFN